MYKETHDIIPGMGQEREQFPANCSTGASSYTSHSGFYQRQDPLSRKRRRSELAIPYPDAHVGL